MHIGYADIHGVPGFAPPAIQMLYTADALAREATQVTLVTPAARNPIRPEDVLGRLPAEHLRLHPLMDWTRWLPFRSNRPFLWVAGRLLERLAPDVLLVRNLKLAESLLRLQGLPPLYFETHELFARTHAEWRQPRSLGARRKLARLEARERLVYERSAGLFALTHLLAEDIRSAYGVDTATLVVPDAVDLEQADAATPLPRTSSRPRLLYLGSLHAWKGVEFAVRALPLLPETELQVVGGAPERIAALAALGHQLGVADRLDLVGAVPPVDRFAYIKAADVCLLPLTHSAIASRYTSPLKLFEYLACGRAVVASDLPSIREVVDMKREVVAAPAEDPEGIAHAVRSVLDDEERRRDLEQAARQAANRYSWTTRANRMTRFMNAGAA